MASWRGILRELERAEKRRARQSAYKEKQQAIAEKTEIVQNAINKYENLINDVISLHKECCDYIDWKSFMNSDPPPPITKDNHFGKIAQEKKNNFKPSRLNKLMGRTNKELSKLDEEILLAKEKDKKSYEDQVKNYEKELIKWEKDKEIASKIIRGEEEAIEEVLNSKILLKSTPFFGKEMFFHFKKNEIIKADILVHKIDEIIPSFDLKQLKSGNLSKKDMPKTRRLELYKEYVCSATIRLGREIFAILPEEKILINAKCNQLNGKTGHMEEVIILSAFMLKETLKKINFQLIKPSLAIENFKFNMDFKKLSGFREVEQVSIDEKSMP